VSLVKNDKFGSSNIVNLKQTGNEINNFNENVYIINVLEVLPLCLIQ